ncbi:MAG: TIGR02680 family protein [Anaerovoracaceae bacterium]
MLNSKWQIHRIGLIDFWYYDDEEFYFMDGRLLLRGANGSGKSVTMQSFIPLLLDGNKSPARLDPFGTNARQIGNYLLEDNDGREERTGYLYMEFKRADSETFITIGMGLKATRRTNKVDSWYFLISDGRRIGRDFYLYKEADSKICLSKVELRNRIAGGGAVLEGQREYMELVNKQLFGFETIDEYKELINLLIQLRTPKLSKDFKPTVINEILSNSLQSLSEDDLRPMSEAVENMDILEANLENLRNSKKAADKIMSVYDQYNRVVLHQKANQYLESGDQLRAMKDEANRNEKRLGSLQQRLAENQTRKISLEEEFRVLEDQKKNLEKNDAVALKEEQLRLTEEINKARAELRDQEDRYENKRQRRVETASKHKDKLQETQQQKSHIEKKTVLMEEAIDSITFDEHFFMADELKANLDRPYDFQMVKHMIDALEEDIEKGLDELKEEERVGRQHDEALSNLEEQKKERHRLEREGATLENQLLEIKGELIEKLHKWNRQNAELILPIEQMQDISRWIDNYNQDSDFAGIKDQIREEKNKREDIKNKEKQALENQKDLLAVKIEEKQSELFKWESNEDPEPPRDSSVLRNRQILDEKNIPNKPFYKLIDFNESMTEEQSDRIEESLLQMGILDALIIPENYKEQVLNVDKGLCDRYIFCDPKEVKESMSSMLTIDQDEYDLVMYQQITNLLNAVGTMEGAGTYIDLQGNYGIGVLKGTITKEYKAKYIGVRARQMFRRETIGQLKSELEELQAKMDSLNKQINDITNRILLLNEEHGNFPAGEDLKTAWKDLIDNDEKLQKQIEAVQASEIKATELQRQRSEIKNRIFALAKKVNLMVDIPAFTDARGAVKEYKSLLGDLMILHSRYLQVQELLNNLGEKLEDIDGDLDEILYDKNKIERRLSGEEQKLSKCDEQLAMSNYEEIKEQLDHCLTRLMEVPQEKDQTIELITDTKNKIEYLEKDIEKNQQNAKLFERKHEHLMRGFEAEYQLRYLDFDFEQEGNPETQGLAISVCTELNKTLPNKSKEDLHGILQGKYYENRPDLVEYSLALTEIFIEQPEEDALGMDLPSFKRTDIVGKFRGKQIKFHELLRKLEGDIQDQENLLEERDRELFEEILANTISKKIRNRIYNSENWVKKMNKLMESMNTSSGLTLSLAWKSKRAEQEEQLDTRELVELLKRDAEIMGDDEFKKLSHHFRSKIQEARKLLIDSDRAKTFHLIMKEVLDYRKWFEFQLYYRKTGEDRKELTDRTFNAFSGGEKAITMYVPLFSAVVAKYAGARADAPKLISLDEAFAGVDENNINDLFRMLVELEFNFIINSQILWGDYETVPKLAIYQLLRPENAKFVTVIPYAWNGFIKKAMVTPGELDEG